MENEQTWKPETYDRHLAFVSQLGQGALELLAPKKGERILDLGCGTGDLTKQIAESGAIVSGMDYSESMIAAARSKFPGLPFHVGNGEQFQTDEPFDAVFSNAALHWMKGADGAIASVWNSLRPGGRFVGEFGGKGNVDLIVRSILDVLPEYGVTAPSDRNPWFFPSAGEYASKLERQGFWVRSIEHFPRPTALPDGEIGFIHWLDQFADVFFAGFTAPERQAAQKEIAALIQSRRKAQGAAPESAVADYVRLRFVAIKP
ncbi:class I SAM-dependent methyltransferase [Paenibacillus sp. NPDC058071]|uniref:class I SAM-dependent methyltransferase n=1 Tax=Paenibacillus sp. NPDC058071 TaxID=3346326 RepID=UPI0036D8D1B6